MCVRSLMNYQQFKQLQNSTCWLLFQLLRPIPQNNSSPEKPDKSSYDMIRYDTVDLRALKSWRDGQLNLAHAQKRKIMKKKSKTE